MKTLNILLVAVPGTMQTSLFQSLTQSHYQFEVSEVADKRQALVACSQFRYDILIASHNLPDGQAEDLINVLNGSMACLILERGHVPADWIEALSLTLDDWKSKVEGKTRQHFQFQQLRHASALERCGQELRAGATFDNALKVILDVMEISRVYVRETPIDQVGPPVITYEITAPGHLPLLGSRRSAYEVSVQRAGGRMFHLGIEDVTHQRQWSKSETDFIQAMAYLLKDKSNGAFGTPNPILGIRLSA
ncbi:hypothetical protein [Persicitalea jodogahamensis]|uniref:Uncharacterized protein n=1 Tax=Persicitalea jodogahamensis TaxID=402147 RepID=A0A8J3G8T0_9BACT|nr:hypothetical protein [Persicitalea jodogahamensis]GHB57563.1 hypothetical protein GCM10007390_08730 [Persicitalea jodogahamensis]